MKRNHNPGLTIWITVLLCTSAVRALTLEETEQILAEDRYAEAAKKYEALVSEQTLGAAARAQAWRGKALAHLARMEDVEAMRCLAQAVLAQPDYAGNIGLLNRVEWLVLNCGPSLEWPALMADLREAAKDFPELICELDYLQIILDKCRGEFARADSLSAVFSHVDRYLVAGPFPNVAGSGFTASYEPEWEIDTTATYRGNRGQSFGWMKVNTQSASDVVHDGRVDLDLLLDDEAYAAVYAVTHVRSEGERPAVIHVSGGGSFRLWCNGELALSEPEYRVAGDPLYLAPVRLRAGWNRLLLKVCAEREKLFFNLRISDTTGAPLALQVDPDPSRYTASGTGGERGANTPLEGVANFPEHTWLRRWQAQEAEASLADLYWKTVFLMDRRFSAEAEELLEGAGGRPEGSALLKNLQALLMEIKHREKEAGEIRQQAARQAPELLRARVAWMVQLMGEGEIERAWQLMEEVEELFPDSAQLRMFEGLRQAFNGSVQEGLAVIQRGFEEQPGNTGLQKSYYRLLHSAGSKDEQEQAIRRFHEERKDVGSHAHALATRHQQRHETELALEWLDKARRAGLRADKVYREKTAALEQRGRLEEALEQAREGLRLAPRSRRLNGSAANLLMKLGHERDALPHLEACVSREPSDFEKRDLIRRIRDLKPLMEYFPELDQQSLRAEDLGWVEEGEHAVYLFDSGEYTVHPDGATEWRHHFCIKLLDEAGVENYRETVLPIEGANQELEIARTIKADGRVIDAEHKGMEVAFADVAPGDLVEARYVMRKTQTVGLYERFWNSHFFQVDLPCLLCRFSLLMPEDMEYTYKTYHMELQPASTVEDGLRLDVFEDWRRPSYLVEPGMPPEEESIAWIDCSNVSDWREIVEWYEGMSSGRLRARDEIRRLAVELGAGAADDSTRLRRVAHHVLEEYQYQGGAFSISGFIPRSMKEILRTRYGDCKDLSALIISLLREMGIEACFALVNSREVMTMPYLPSPRFTHAVVRARTEDGRVFWIDPTAKGLRFPNIPSELEGMPALLVDPARPEFVIIPKDATATNRTRSDLAARIEEDGAMQVRGEVLYTGEDAQMIRLTLAGIAPEQKEELVRYMACQEFPGARLEEYELTAGPDLEEDVRLSFSYALDAAATFAGGMMILPLPWAVNRVPRDLVSLESRETPLVNEGYRGLFEETVTLSMPEDFELVTEMKPVSLECTLGRYSIGQVTGIANDEDPAAVEPIVLHRQFEVDSIRVSQEDYPEFREMILKAWRAENEQLVLREK